MLCHAAIDWKERPVAVTRFGEPVAEDQQSIRDGEWIAVHRDQWLESQWLHSFRRRKAASGSAVEDNRIVMSEVDYLNHVHAVELDDYGSRELLLSEMFGHRCVDDPHQVAQLRREQRTL